jgi:hypothetical protein
VNVVLDYALSKSMFIPLDGGKAFVCNGGDIKASGSLLDDIGKAVVIV